MTKEKLLSLLERSARTCAQTAAGVMLATMLADGEASFSELPAAAGAGGMAALVCALMFVAGPFAPRKG